MSMHHKERACPYCGALGHRPEHEPCGQCQRDMKLGQNMRMARMEAEKTGELVNVRLGHMFLYNGGSANAYHRPGEEPGRLETKDFMRAMLNLADAKGPGYNAYGPAVKTLWPSGSWNEGDPAFALRPNQVVALEQLLTFIHQAIGDAYWQGHRSGRDLIGGLARGEVSLQDWNDRTFEGPRKR